MAARSRCPPSVVTAGSPSRASSSSPRSCVRRTRRRRVASRARSSPRRSRRPRRGSREARGDQALRPLSSPPPCAARAGPAREVPTALVLPLLPPLDEPTVPRADVRSPRAAVGALLRALTAPWIAVPTLGLTAYAFFDSLDNRWCDERRRGKAREGEGRSEKATEGGRRRRKATEGDRRRQKVTEGDRRRQKASEGSARAKSPPPC